MNVNHNTVPLVPSPTPVASTLEAEIAALHLKLKAMKTKDLTDAQYELLCVLDNEYSDRD